MGWWIAASLVEGGRDLAWVRMVMAEKGHGEIDLDRAREWRASGGTRCLCVPCEQSWRRQLQAFRGVEASTSASEQLSLF